MNDDALNALRDIYRPIFEARQQGYTEAFAALESETGARCYLYTMACPVQVYIILPDGRAIYWRERCEWEARWATRIPGTSDGFDIDWESDVIAEGEDYEGADGWCEAHSFLDIARKIIHQVTTPDPDAALDAIGARIAAEPSSGHNDDEAAKARLDERSQ